MNRRRFLPGAGKLASDEPPIRIGSASRHKFTGLAVGIASVRMLYPSRRNPYSDDAELARVAPKLGVRRPHGRGPEVDTSGSESFEGFKACPLLQEAHSSS